MKLNIYKGKMIIKTYETDAYELTFGTVEDVVDAAQLDKIQHGSDEEVMAAAARLVTNSMGTVRELMKDIFDGLTDEELRGARISEIISVLTEVVFYAIGQISVLGGKRKN